MPNRWQVREVYADADERGVVGVLRADPVDWDTGELQRGGRVLGEVKIKDHCGYYWSSNDLKMSSTRYWDTAKLCMRELVDAEDRQGRLTLTHIDPQPEDDEAVQRHIADTREHIRAVQNNLSLIIEDLVERHDDHDRSKMVEPELFGFAAMNADARLKDLTYGSPEYRAVLKEHRPTIDHHYQTNDHHPEHYPNGIAGMTLGALCEMLADWEASSHRMKDGDLRLSILHNADRFGYDAVLAQILINTAVEFGWIK